MAKKTAVTDPLEASKILSKPEAAPPPDFTPPESSLAPTGAVQPEGPPPRRFRVVQDTTISVNGQLTKLYKDDVIGDATHGPDNLDRILGSNVALVAVE
jgi:hypothetical protein